MKGALARDSASVGVYESNLLLTGGQGTSCLLIIDPQKDFVTGSLVVNGAVEDCVKIANFIERRQDICQIFVSLDTHMQFHIAHKSFWKKLRLAKSESHDYDWSTAEVCSPSDFEVIPFKAVKGFITDPIDEKYVIRFVTSKDEFTSWGLYYTEKLEECQGLVLVIWPDHCLLGSEGHCVEEKVYSALKEWERKHNKTTEFILKGKNALTEHYSAFKAEVEVEGDDKTCFNEQLYQTLIAYGKIYVAGEARSHCVNQSVRHLLKRMRKDGLPADKICLLKGAMSDVPGFEKVGEEFWNDMMAQGVLFENISELQG